VHVDEIMGGGTAGGSPHVETDGRLAIVQRKSAMGSQSEESCISGWLLLVEEFDYSHGLVQADVQARHSSESSTFFPESIPRDKQPQPGHHTTHLSWAA
jgi:hypothetical protein